MVTKEAIRKGYCYPGDEDHYINYKGAMTNAA